MAKIKQPFGETRFVPWIGRDVEHGEIVEVPDDQLASYMEGGWEPADKPTKDAHQKLLADSKTSVGTLKPVKATPAKADTATPDKAEAGDTDLAQQGEQETGDKAADSEGEGS